MALRLFNTMTQKKEDFVPLVPGKVGIYVCGVTVYDLCHVGHARCYVAFDTIVRWLARSFQVTYVRNFTDVDDKIIRRGNEIGEDPIKLAARFADEFHRDMDALGVKRADIEPRVSTTMPEIIKFTAGLVEKGFAYPVATSSTVEGAGHDVYFRVRKMGEPYLKLSHKSFDDLLSGARVAVDERKEDALDFALWKSAKPGEPFWESPFGRGRPGWHIECSAMAEKHLGVTFDIHGGGKDLVFPHHTNEIAQSECLHGTSMSRFWLHNGFVNVAMVDANTAPADELAELPGIGREIAQQIVAERDARGAFATFDDFAKRLASLSASTMNKARGQLRFTTASADGAAPADLVEEMVDAAGNKVTTVKMSKSLDNFFTIRDVLKHYTAESLRLLLLSTQYRGPIAYSLRLLEDAEGRVQKLYETRRRIAQYLAKNAREDGPSLDGAFSKPGEPFHPWQSFAAAMDDDFNTAEAIAALWSVVKVANLLVDGKEKEVTGVKLKPGVRAHLLGEAQRMLEDMGSVLGVGQQDPAAFVTAQRALRIGARGIDLAAVEKLLAERATARAEKNWPAADAARDALVKLGVEVRDTPEGVEWSVA